MHRTALLFLALASTAWAQPVITEDAKLVGSGTDFLRADGGDPVPDTTAPWRYFPLHVGDAWEYYHYQTGERRRVDVLGEETYNGRHYFLWRSRYYDADGESTGTWGPVPVRFDTTSAMARMFIPEIGEESRFPFSWTPCPLDAPFYSEIACPEWEPTYEVGGGYDGLLAFGGEFPGTGTDTVRTAVKTYYSYHPGHTYDYRYAADIGFVFGDDGYASGGIYYAKVDGVEYGQPFYPVASEDGVPEVEALTLWAYPNPFRERLIVAFEVVRAGPVVVEVVDVLGRVVRRRDLGVVPAGRREVALGGEELPAGVYVVRVTSGQERAVRRVVRVR